MKANKLVLMLFLTIALIGCKKEEKVEEKLDQQVETPKAEVFTFTLNAVIKADDDFQIFFKEDNDSQSPYEEVNSVWSGAIKGNENAQDIVFTLPEAVYPTQIRFDFGQKKQDEILINSLKVDFKDKSVTFKGAEFFNFFTPDENFVKVDKTNSKIIPIEQKDGKFDPMLYSNTDFTTEMSKLAQ